MQFSISAISHRILWYRSISHTAIISTVYHENDISKSYRMSAFATHTTEMGCIALGLMSIPIYYSTYWTTTTANQSANAKQPNAITKILWLIKFFQFQLGLFSAGWNKTLKLISHTFRTEICFDMVFFLHVLRSFVSFISIPFTFLEYFPYFRCCCSFVDSVVCIMHFIHSANLSQTLSMRWNSYCSYVK